MFIFCSTSCITSGHRQACLAIMPVSRKRKAMILWNQEIYWILWSFLMFDIAFCFVLQILNYCCCVFFLRNYFIFLPLLKFSVICRWNVIRFILISDLNVPFERGGKNRHLAWVAIALWRCLDAEFKYARLSERCISIQILQGESERWGNHGKGVDGVLGPTGRGCGWCLRFSSSGNVLVAQQGSNAVF